MTCSRWLLLVGMLWLPASLLAQSGVEPTRASMQHDTVRRGMGVFGNVLSIHGADTLALRGDLVLVEAEIGGEGVLSLCDSQPQRIIARKSSIQNLHIANATKVIVQGELRINKSLVIEKGVFDSRLATLMLSDTCRFRVEKEGQLLWPDNHFLVKQTTAVPQDRSASSTAWIDKRQELTIRLTDYIWAYSRLTNQQFTWLQRESRPPSPPPEASYNFASISKA